MSRWIDADALTADIQERYCKPCKERKEDYNEVRCRVCWVDDAMDEIDGFADNSIDIVRCGECVKANTEDCSHSYWDDDWGEWRVGYKGDDWFCADGEREDE